ncbi:hypothetical protein ACJJTC_007199 [Scirpophaga incertulas]
MGTLQEIPRSDWAELRDLYKKDWPRCVEGYCLLDTQISYPALAEVFNFKVYCPGGKMSNGFIGIIDFEKKYQQMHVCPLDDITPIEDALTHTDVIDWDRVVNVPSVNSEIKACVERFCKRANLKVIYDNKVHKYLLDKGFPVFDIDEKSPNNVCVGPVKPEFLDLVDCAWTFHDPEYTRRLFETFTKNGMSYVLYSTETNEPLSWIFHDEAGSFTHLYCVEEYRRNGYAEYITKIATNSLLKQGKYVLTHTLEKNKPAADLFTKLGFEEKGFVWWLQLSK